MRVMQLGALVLGLLSWAVPTPGLAATPVRVVEGSLDIPAGMGTAEALESVQDVAGIFDSYQPVIPRIPGVRVDLEKQLVSAEGPTVVELPVLGSVFGRDIDERARVTATSVPASCGAAGDGVMITLDFGASSYNIERRIDRIEITACPDIESDGQASLHAIGRMYAGFKPEDPELNALNEAIGSRALQGAFIKQVPAVFTAVEAHWNLGLAAVVDAPGADGPADQAASTASASGRPPTAVPAR